MVTQNDFAMDYTINPVGSRGSLILPSEFQMTELVRGPNLGSNHDIHLARFVAGDYKIGEQR